MGMNVDARESALVADGKARGASEEEISTVVTAIQRVCRNSSLEFALQVGRIIIHHFYGGDTSAWRARGPKTTSFRRLAAHPSLPMSPGALYRCVAIFELCDRLEAVSRFNHLGASHLRSVFGLPSEVQEKLLLLANANRWTVPLLKGEVCKYKSLARPRGGRRSRTRIGASLHTLEKWLESCSRVIGEELVAEDHDEEAIQTLEETRRRIAQVDQLLLAWRDRLTSRADLCSESERARSIELRGSCSVRPQR